MTEPSEEEINAQFFEIASQEMLKATPFWQALVDDAARAIRECFNYLDGAGFQETGSFVIGTVNLGNIKDGPMLPIYRVIRADKSGRFDHNDE